MRSNITSRIVRIKNPIVIEGGYHDPTRRAGARTGEEPEENPDDQNRR